MDVFFEKSQILLLTGCKSMYPQCFSGSGVNPSTRSCIRFSTKSKWGCDKYKGAPNSEIIRNYKNWWALSMNLSWFASIQ